MGFVPDSQKNYFDRQYARKAFFVPRDVCFVVYGKKIWDDLKLLLKDCRVIADFGAGGGTLLYNVSRITSAKLIAIEFSETATRQLNEIVPRAQILKEDVLKTSLADNSLDMALSVMTIEHVDDVSFLKEIHRCLKPQGKVFLSTVLRGKNAWYFYKGKNGETLLEPTHLREYDSLKSFEDLCVSGGFKILESSIARIKYPCIDPILKILFGFTLNRFWRSIPASRPVEYLRKVLRLPIPGYWSIEVIAQKK